MKKYLIILCLLVGTLVSQSQPVKRHGALQVNGTQLIDSKGEATVLRGMSFGWHNFWPRFYNADAVKWLAKDWKCTVVRAAMGIEPKGAYLQDSAAATQKIEAVIDAAIAEGIYVIVDWHSHNMQPREAKSFFTSIAAKYGRYPNLIYEIFNEPDQESWAEVKSYSKEIIETIRAIDPDNIILVGSPHWDQDIHLVADDPLTGFSNIMYSLHFYAATHKQSLRDRADYALSKGIPIFVSESAGMEASGNGPLNLEEWKTWIAWCEQKKISWVTWSVSDKDETCSVLQKSAAAGGKWKTKDLKQSGVLARALLRKYAGKK